MFPKKAGEGRVEGKKASVFLLKNGSLGLTNAPSWNSEYGFFLRIPQENVCRNEREEFFFNLFHRREWYLFLKDGIYYARFSQKFQKRL